MDSLTILIIVSIFSVSIIMMIILAIYQNKKKDKQATFLTEHDNDAIIAIWAENIQIDANKLTAFDFMKGPYGEYIVALPEGNHVISAKYKTTSTGLNGNKNWQSGQINSTIFCKKNMMYQLSIYDFSAQERENYYGEKQLAAEAGRCIYEEKLSGTATFSRKSFYILCYEKLR